MPRYRDLDSSDSGPSSGLSGTLSRRQLLAGTAAVTAAGLIGTLAPSEVRAAAGKKVGFLVPDYDQLRWKNGDQRFFEAKQSGSGSSPSRSRRAARNRRRPTRSTTCSHKASTCW